MRWNWSMCRLQEKKVLLGLGILLLTYIMEYLSQWSVSSDTSVDTIFVSVLEYLRTLVLFSLVGLLVLLVFLEDRSSETPNPVPGSSLTPPNSETSLSTGEK